MSDAANDATTRFVRYASAVLGEVLAGRYRVADALGRGTEGVVYRAHDLVGGGQVAVKLAPASRGARRSALSEAALLRLARVRGVAQVLDEGTHGGHTFVVTELVDGTPFPGRPTPTSWDSLRDTALSLLDTLERVHGAGVVHADLKPGNVFVRPDGRPVLLDFGIARRTVTGGATAAGTPAFMAPELFRGARSTVASDLYAFGVMLHIALTGVLPHDGATEAEQLRSRLTRAPAVATDIAPGRVEAALARLLAIEPQARPESAVAARLALDGVTHDGGGGAPPSASRDPRSETELRELFCGEDRLFHLRTDAARVLHRATGGDPDAVANVLARWARGGLVRPSDGRFWIDRVSLGELLELEKVPDPRLPLAERVVLITRSALDEGDALSAAAMLEAGAKGLRDCQPETLAVRDEVFLMWLELVISEQSAAGADRLRHELWQQDAVTALMVSSGRIADAVVLFAGDPRRAFEALQHLGEQALPRLERARVSLAMVAARSIDIETEQAVLRSAEAYARMGGDRVFAARLDGWRGRLAYREGRYEEAARLHESSAGQLSQRLDVVLARLNQAAAHVEAFALEAAADATAVARGVLGLIRHPLFEARMEWLTRVTTYRMGRDLAPDVELIDACAQLNVPHLEAQIALAEAAFAWRGGDLPLAADLAARAERLWRQIDTLVDLARCARALQLACGASGSAELAPDLARRARSAEIPGVGIQTLGLLALAGYRPAAQDLAAVPRLVGSVPAQHHTCRIDVISVEEARTYLQCSP